MTQHEKTPPTRLPGFTTAEEAVAFWDAHSPEDFPDDLEEVEVTFSRPLMKRGLIIELEDGPIKELHTKCPEEGH